MIKKWVVMIMAALLCLSAFAACAPTQPSAPDQTPSAETSAQPSASEEASAEGGVITFYGFSDWMQTDPYKAAYEGAKAKFEEENPGFTVELQSDPWGDWEQKYKTMFAAGDPADVFMVNNHDFPTFANSGNLLDMTSYVQDGYFDDFFQGVLNMYKWQGSTMAIPFTTDCRILWYNKDIFEEAGLDPNKAPATWEELAADAKQITDKTGKYGFGMDLGLQEFPTQALFCASNSSILNVADDGTVTPNVDTPEFRSYLTTLNDMKETYEPDYTILTHHDVANLFAAGQIGIIIGNTLEATTIYDTDWYAQALVPSFDGTSNGSYGGGFGISVSSSCKYPEQAVKFAQMVCSPEFCGAEISDIPASNAGVANCEKAKDTRFDRYFAQIQYARQAQPKTLYYAEIDVAVNEIVAEVIVNNMSVDDAVKALEEKITEIVSE